MQPIRGRFVAFVAIVGAGFLSGGGLAPSAAPSDRGPARQMRLEIADLSSPLPSDLQSPEGKTRWDLTALRGKGSVVLTLTEGARGTALMDESSGPGRSWDPERHHLYSALDGGDSALRWVFPERFADLMRPGARAALDLHDEGGGFAGRLHIDLETVGIGWVLLPSGPREVVLQR